MYKLKFGYVYSKEDMKYIQRKGKYRSVYWAEADFLMKPNKTPFKDWIQEQYEEEANE